MTQTYGQTGTQTYARSQEQTGAQRGEHGLHVLDDRDILTDLLLCSKQLLSAYGTATIECTNPQLRQTLKQISKTEADFHTKTFEMMQQRGWYETPRSDQQLASQIASLWTQKMQRPTNENHRQGAYPSQQYGAQQAQQGWQQQGGSSWQHGWSGTGGDQWNQPWNAWQGGQAAARTWNPGQGPDQGKIPGAHT